MFGNDAHETVASTMFNWPLMFWLATHTKQRLQSISQYYSQILRIKHTTQDDYTTTMYIYSCLMKTKMYLCDLYTQPCILKYFVMSFAGIACLGNKAMHSNIVMYCHHVYGDIAVI